MNKYTNILASVIVAGFLAACNSGGGDSATSVSEEAKAKTDPYAHLSPSVKVLDARILPDDDHLIVDIDLYPTNEYGDFVTNLKDEHFGVFPNPGVTAAQVLVSTPITPHGEYIPGNYSLTVVLDQTDTMRDSDPTDMRLEAVKSLSDNLKAGDEIQVISYDGNGYHNVSGGFVSKLDHSLLSPLANSEGGKSYMYDAILNGLGSGGILNGTNYTKIVVVISDGHSEFSYGSAAEVVALATSEGWKIPVYMLAINDIHSADLTVEHVDMALATGGLYSAILDVDHTRSLIGQLSQLFGVYDATSKTSYSFKYTVSAIIQGAPADKVSGSVLVQIGHETVSVPFSVDR